MQQINEIDRNKRLHGFFFQLLFSRKLNQIGNTHVMDDGKWIYRYQTRCKAVLTFYEQIEQNSFDRSSISIYRFLCLRPL